MRVILPAAILFFGMAPDSDAQSACPGVHFNNLPSASLNPTTTTRRNLVRQADGSYTSYETASTSPYGLLSVTPHFEKQLTSCLPAAPPATNPAPLAPANPVGEPSQNQAVALLKSGDYLIASPNTSGGIDAAVFDPQMNLISMQSYAADVGLGPLDRASPLAGIGLADVNGDGNPDLVFVTSGFVDSGPEGTGRVTILLGSGGSSFQHPISYQVSPYGGVVTSFAIGDLNGDRKLDIAVADATLNGISGSIVTFLGNGDGTFQAGPVTGLTVGPNSVALADLNGDGKLDFAIYANFVRPINNVAVAMGNGDGTFAAPSYMQASGSSIAIGDVNNDGIPDIVTGAAILFGDGKGSFPTRQDYAVPQTGAVILTDFNGDGRMDVVIAGGIPALLTGLYSSTITVLFGMPDGTFFGPPVSIVPALLQPGSFITDLRTADFNGDGIPDLVYAGEYGVGAMLGKGDGTFAPSFTSASPAGWEIATGDFNGDGKQDIVSVFAYAQGSGVLTFFAGNGDGTFQAPVKTSVPAGPADLIAGDFNGDGKLDLGVLFSTGSFASADVVTIYIGNGDGSFHQGASYPAGPNASWMLARDLNNDGKLDLIVTNSGSQTPGVTQSGNVTTLLGKGDGTFAQTTQVPLNVSIAGDYGPSTMTLADFNRDGKIDLAVTLIASNKTAAGFAVLLGNGDGTFQSPLINSLLASSIAAVDVNGDGVPDLMVTAQASSSGPSSLYYLLGNGDGSFQPQVSLNLSAGGGDGTPLLFADVNSDRKPDLVSAVWPRGFFSLLNLTPNPPPFRIISSASFALGPVAADSFVSAFGTNLPASMTGLSIQVTDAAGVSRAATPIYASATQLNFLMPAGTSAGVATVSITSPGNLAPLISQVEIAPIAPGLFTENAAGLAAAYAVRVDSQGNQSYVPVFNVLNGTAAATLIDLGASTDQVYLVLFGTGFDAAVPGTVSATIAGQTSHVTYAGPQELAGLDQVNVLVPHGLAGTGDSPVVFSVDGLVANTVHITIK